LLVGLAGTGSVSLAQDPVPKEDPSPAEVPAGVTGRTFEENDQKKRHFGLYVAVAAGQGSSDALGTSIAAGPLDQALSTLEFTEQTYGRATIGWQMRDARKGDLRLIVQGLREEEYRFHSDGVSNRISSDDTADLFCSLNTGEGDTEKDCLIRWWEIDVNNGKLTSLRLIPEWSTEFDAMFGDGDGQPDFGPCVDLGSGIERCGEITYNRNSPDRLVTGQLADDLQNRIQTFDLVYGREFGTRRFSSRWWTGVRYFNYEGQLLAAAWLHQGEPGVHFTDGSFLRLLNISQQTSGAGPIGSWQIDFNFFNKGLVLFARGEVAFTFNDMSIDSGDFFRTTSEEGGDDAAIILVQDRMSKDLQKSTWQNKAEIGAKFNFKNGLQLELGFSRAGYLDIFLMPDLLQLGGEQVTNNNPQTFTQDLIVDAFHAGVGFQF
jgi:hypothetical protein